MSMPTIAGYDRWKFHDPREHEDRPYVTKPIETTIGGHRVKIWSILTDEYCTPKAEFFCKDGTIIDLEEIAENHPRLAEKIVTIGKRKGVL